MTGRQKILQVLKDIKKESEINPDPNWVIFHFTLMGIERDGKLNRDQQKRILVRLHMKKIIEIILPQAQNHEDSLFLRRFNGDPVSFCLTTDTQSTAVKLLPKFHLNYWVYKITSFNENAWNYINPFWLLFQAGKLILFCLGYLFEKMKNIIPTIIKIIIESLK